MVNVHRSHSADNQTDQVSARVGRRCMSSGHRGGEQWLTGVVSARDRPTHAAPLKIIWRVAGKCCPLTRPQGLSITNWSRTTFAADAFQREDNIGIQFGDVSNGLCDVDLDCAEARALAPLLLPPTDAVFLRRATAPQSHWLYVSDLWRTAKRAARRPTPTRCLRPRTGARRCCWFVAHRSARQAAAHGWRHVDGAAVAAPVGRTGALVSRWRPCARSRRRPDPRGRHFGSRGIASAALPGSG